MSRSWKPAACGLAMVITGCASTSPTSPAEVTRAQIARLASGDEAGAAALLAPEVRVKAPQWPAPNELPAPTSVAETERSAVWSGERELELVRTAAGWAIRRGVLALFRLDSAEGALAAFGRALEARDLELVAGLMPEESRRVQVPGALDKAFVAREPAWRALGLAIGGGHVVWLSRDGARAEVLVMVAIEPPPVDPKLAERRVVLVREASGWKVFDVQPWNEYTAP